MGRPGSSPLLRPDPDAMSLHAQQGTSTSTSAHALLDDDGAFELLLDTDDLPPLYTEVVEADHTADDHDASSPHDPLMADTAAPVPWRYVVAPYGTSQGAKSMLSAVRAWARAPPRPYVQLRGTHREHGDRNGKKESCEVVDFDVRVELTPYLYRNAATYEAWQALRTVDAHEKAHRGSVFQHRAPGHRARPQLADDLERGGLADASDGAAHPTVEQWCQRFCDDTAPLRSFVLERHLTGFDHERVRALLEALVRRTNYRGHLVVSFPTDNVGVVWYSDHALNRWRVQRWIQVLFAFTLLFIFAWPYLFLRTKKYAVVHVDWPWSRTASDGSKQYATISEDQWYNLWARAISKAVLSKRQATLDQEDLRQAEGAAPSFVPTGNAAVDGTLGFVSAGINAMNQVNRQLGWGGDC